MQRCGGRRDFNAMLLDRIIDLQDKKNNPVNLVNPVQKKDEATVVLTIGFGGYTVWRWHY